MPQATTTEHWTLRGADGQTIYGTTHLPPADAGVAGTLVICHGFKGYKDYGFFPLLASTAARRGLFAHRFNFSHSGVTDDPRTFARPDLFADNTYTKQVADLLAVQRAAGAGDLPGGAAGLPVSWYGHSRGGLTVVIAAARAAENQTPGPAAVVAAASPSSPQGFTPDQIDRLREQGHVESPSARTGQALRVNRIWLDDIEQHRDAHNPLKAIKQLTCPILLVHGDADQTVLIDAAHQLHRASDGRARLEVLAGAGHTFNAPNPLPDDGVPPPATARMIELTCDFVLSRGTG